MKLKTSTKCESPYICKPKPMNENHCQMKTMITFRDPIRMKPNKKFRTNDNQKTNKKYVSKLIYGIHYRLRTIMVMQPTKHCEHDFNCTPMKMCEYDKQGMKTNSTMRGKAK